MSKKKNLKESKKTTLLPIHELNVMAHKLVELLNTSRTDATEEVIQGIETQQNYLLEKMNQPEYLGIMKNRHALMAFEHMQNALNKQSATGLVKARAHGLKMLRQIRPVTNDYPMQEGDRVAVIRHEHGWPDGSYEGKIYSAFLHNGVWSYNVQVTHEYGKQVEPFHVGVNHTRDLYKISR